MSARTTAFQAVRMAHRWPWKAGVPATGLVLLGWALTWAATTTDVLAALHTPGTWVRATGTLAFAGCTTWWWLRDVARPQSGRADARRREYLANRSHGLATCLDIAERASAGVLRSRARVLRPSTAHLTWWQRARINPDELGVEIARLGWGMWGQRVWLPNEEATLRIAGPRIGKTTALIRIGCAAPGALITTSTRLDLAEGVQAARADRGPVYVFDLDGAIRPGAPVTPVRWRVLDGCTDFETACRRAGDLIPPRGDDQDERWDTKARNLLGLLLHAAAVAGKDMSAVRRWATDADTTALTEVRDALLAVSFGGRHRVDEWRDHCATNDKTRTSVTNTMASAVAWVSDDRARTLGDTPAGDPRIIDIPRMITSGHTLHMIGREGNRIAPLVAALVAEIAHQSRAISQRSPGGRCDPPVTMILDEAAIACPVPLDNWTADMGGRAVTIHIAVQSLSQLQQRWGEAGARTILDNVTLLVHGGSNTAAYLTDVSKLVGDFLAVIDEDDARYIAALPPARIRELGEWEVLVLRRGLRPVLARTPNVLDQRGWKPVPLGELAPPTVDTRVDTGELEAILDETADADDDPARSRWWHR